MPSWSTRSSSIGRPMPRYSQSSNCGSQPSAANLLLAGTAFVLFRVFDILKLPPANRIQNLKGGSGILLDDIVAGAQAWVTLKIILLWKTPTEVIDCLGLTS